MSKSRPITVKLGNQQHLLDDRLQSGAYASASDVVVAGLLALDREQKAFDVVMRGKIQEALEDGRPDIAAEDVFAELRAHHAEQLKADRHGS